MSTIIVTGANRGIGLELVRQYGHAGHRIFACCRNPDDSDELRLLKGDITIVKLDVRRAEDIDTFADRIATTTVDLLINNAAVFGGVRCTLGNLDAVKMLNALQTNVVGPLMLTQSLIENIKSSLRGVVVFLSSRAGLTREITKSGSIIYRSSKAALNSAVRSAAFDLQSHGIACAAINPGFVRTRIGGAGATMSAEESVAALRSVISNITLKNTGHFWHYDGSRIDF